MKTYLKQVGRVFMIPALAITSFIVGFVYDELLVFGIIGAFFIVLSLFIYSGRKQRIRYWFSKYQRYLRDSHNDNVSAIKKTQADFCATKHGDEEICNAEYKDVDVLIANIIKREYEFEKLLRGDVREGLLAYHNEFKKLKEEISEIGEELLGKK